MADDGPDIKVVLKQTVLHGSSHPDMLQKVALVYMDGEEYRVSAPAGAMGDALDWVWHWSVRRPDTEFGGEVDASSEALGLLALKSVQEELGKRKRDASRAAGLNPDGIHRDAQICRRGHIIHCDGGPFDSEAYCTKCGAACIDECPHCKEPIRGPEAHQPSSGYVRPLFCHGCGRPYPWMEDRLTTARDLLRHDDKLTLEDREALWGDLQFVMSDPKSDLAPAKKKLVEIKLGKASQYVREALLDLVAKTTAEYLKG